MTLVASPERPGGTRRSPRRVDASEGLAAIIAMGGTMFGRWTGGSEWLDALLYDRVIPRCVVSDGVLADRCSEADDLCDLVHEEFLHVGFAALSANSLRMSPRSQHPCAGFVEHDDESVGVRVSEEIGIGAPVRHGLVTVETGTLEDPTEAAGFGIENPSAVAGVDGDVGHAAMVGDQPVSDL